MDSPLKWMGGKHHLRETIIGYIPAHKTYVEPFGGAGWVLLGKPPSLVEVFNDLNGRLVNLWRVVKFNRREFTAYLEDHLVSEELFHQYLLQEGYARGRGGIPAGPGPTGGEISPGYTCGGSPGREGIPEGAAPARPPGVYPGGPPTCREGIPGAASVVAAARYYYLVKCAWNGVVTDGATFAASRGRSGGFLTFHGTDWKAISNRLQRMTILGRDFQEVIERYDGPRTFFYCDPPYQVATDSPKYYEHTFTPDDHLRLRETLGGLEGRFILSYDRVESILELYRGFHVREVPIKYREGGVELLISNFELTAGPYRLQRSRPPAAGGRWDNPNCPYCRSLDTQQLYKRATHPDGRRTFKARVQGTQKATGAVPYTCNDCGEVYPVADQKI